MPHTSHLIQQGYDARRENRLADAHRDFTEAVETSRRKGNGSELIRALKGLAQIEHDIGERGRARGLYEEAVTLCRGESDALQLAHTIRHLGQIYYEEDRLDLAEQCYQEALALYRSEDQTLPLDLANAIRPLALLKVRTGSVDEAIPLWNEARELYASVNVLPGVTECSNQLSQFNQ